MRYYNKDCNHSNKVYYGRYEGCPICPSEIGHISLCSLDTYQGLAQFIKIANITKVVINNTDIRRIVKKCQGALIGVLKAFSESRVQQIAFNLTEKDTLVWIQKYLPNIPTIIRIDKLPKRFKAVISNNGRIIEIDTSINNPNRVDDIISLLKIPYLEKIRCGLGKKIKPKEFLHKIKSSTSESEARKLDITFSTLGSEEIEYYANVLPTGTNAVLNLKPKSHPSDWSNLGSALSDSKVEELTLDHGFYSDSERLPSVDRDISPILKSIVNPHLLKLCLSHIQLDQNLCEVLAKALPHSQIKIIDFNEVTFDDDGAIALAKGIEGMTELNDLTLYRYFHKSTTYYNGEKAFIHIVDSLANKGLKNLHITSINITSGKSSQSLKTLLLTNPLKKLSFEDINIEMSMIQAIAEVLPNISLDTLSFERTNLTEDKYMILISAIIKSKITELHISSDPASAQVVEYIVKNMNFSNLCDVNISGKFSLVAADKLSNAFLSTNLKNLHIKNMDITDPEVTESIVDGIIWANTDPNRNCKNAGLADVKISYSMCENITQKALNHGINFPLSHSLLNYY